MSHVCFCELPPIAMYLVFAERCASDLFTYLEHANLKF